MSKFLCPPPFLTKHGDQDTFFALFKSCFPLFILSGPIVSSVSVFFLRHYFLHPPMFYFTFFIFSLYQTRKPSMFKVISDCINYVFCDHAVCTEYVTQFLWLFFKNSFFYFFHYAVIHSIFFRISRRLLSGHRHSIYVFNSFSGVGGAF